MKRYVKQIIIYKKIVFNGLVSIYLLLITTNIRLATQVEHFPLFILVRSLPCLTKKSQTKVGNFFGIDKMHVRRMIEENPSPTRKSITQPRLKKLKLKI